MLFAVQLELHLELNKRAIHGSFFFCSHRKSNKNNKVSNTVSLLNILGSSILMQNDGFCHLSGPRKAQGQACLCTSAAVRRGRVGLDASEFP